MVKGKTPVNRAVNTAVKSSANTLTNPQVKTLVKARVNSQTCSVNVVPEKVFKEEISYFSIEDGKPIINVNIKSIRYPDSFVYEFMPDRAEMAGQFTQVQVYPTDNVVKFFIEQPGGIAIFIKLKDKTVKNDNFIKRAVSFGHKNEFSQQDINKISRLFLSSLLKKIENTENTDRESDIKVIRDMLGYDNFMMTIVEGMVTLKDVICNQNQFGDPIVSLTLNPLPRAQRPSGGKSKKNKSKKGTKRRNKSKKRKTRKYKNNN